MSAIKRLKDEIRQSQMEKGSFNAFRDLQHPDRERYVVLPKKSHTKEKIMVVDKETKRSRRACSKGHQGSKHDKLKEQDTTVFGDNDTDSEEEDEESGGRKKATVKRVPWGPQEILEHLDNPAVVENLPMLIASLHGPEDDEKERKKKEKITEITVWDHGKTKEGDQSDNNFFLWLEAYTALKSLQQREAENAVFN